VAGSWSAGLSAARAFREGREDHRRLGFHVGGRLRGTTRVDYELRHELSLERVYHQKLRLFHRMASGSASVSWARRQNHQQSWILEYFKDEDWYASSFDEDLYPLVFNELRAHVSRPCMFLEGWTAKLTLVEVFVQDKDRGESFPESETRGDGLSLALARRGIELGYRLQRGFGGDRDDLFGSIRYEPWDRMELWAELNKVYYRFGGDVVAENERDDEALTTRFGVDLEFPHGIDTQLALELLQNPRAEQELRFLGKVDFRFQLRHEG
jgi:hypothetical protein